ncbi:hypothetical protein [Actinoalloteichus fjordicus]|uniref:hypothetical protein n=1 Tax=Actinoalloteichus fjordicus TaxID=1612552 RepID=UPI0012F738CB|nr:hypothetical protein [Actinoalloteichus fjordicus]
MPRTRRRLLTARQSTTAEKPEEIFGAVEVEIEGELAQLGPTGYRPLRVRDTLF